VRTRGIQAVAHDPESLAAILLLAELNEAYAILRCLTFARGVHPYVAYCELCRVVGTLSIFGDERAIDDFPVYDHDDLATVFAWIRPRIEQLIRGGVPQGFEQRPFIGTGMGRMGISLEDRWLGEDWTWFVGVLPNNVNEQQCRELLMPGKLQWKMGSAGMIDAIFTGNMAGVEMQYQPHAPSALPANQGYVYYSVKRTGAFWQRVFVEKTLGLRFSNHLIQNNEKLTGSEELVISADGYPKAFLRFTLFAVPRKTG
jgi:type VI secretion system protein ImpJ